MSNNFSIQNIARRYPVWVFYVLALAISWSIELLLTASVRGWIAVKLPMSLHYLASFGPMVAALIATGLVSGTVGLQELWRRITRWRVGWQWALVSILSPVVAFVACLPVVRLIKGEWPDLRLLGQANYLPDLGLGVVLLWLATFGFGEEIGWRGFVLPRLQKYMSVSRATLFLGLMWVLWHIPAFFYLDTYQNLNWFIMPGFIFGVLCGAVIFTWIYNVTGGSVMMVAIWHALFDLFSASKAGQDVIPMIMTALVIIFALYLTNVNTPWSFHRLAKHTL